MIAVDTNVLVRLLTGDDPKQARAAKSLFAAETIWIAKTVLLETGWVLQNLYRFEENVIRDAFVKLLGLKNVDVEDGPSVIAALDLLGDGIDLADAIHLASKPSSTVFFTLDRSFVRRAHRAGVKEISEVPA